MDNQRGTWGSHFGFLMAAVGSAVGLGNLWAFPYKMGSNGGFAFLIVYLALVILVGLAITLGELALGRKTARGAIGAYQAMHRGHGFIGFMGVAAGFIVLAFYVVLGGLVLRYVAGYAVGLAGGDGFNGQGAGYFHYLLYEPDSILLYSAIFVIINCTIVMGGIRGGIERFSKAAMPALVFFLIIIIVYVACQDNAAAGYAFMFTPDWDYLKNNFFQVLKIAAGQMFFSLSLGMGCMITYGSYLPKSTRLLQSAVVIALGDTVTALMAGCAMLPAVASFAEGNYGTGPDMLFSTMLHVFNNIGGFTGDLMGFIFFLLVFIAAVTSAISQLEVCNATIIDRRLTQGKATNRHAVTILFSILAFAVGMPCALDAMGGGSALLKAPYELLGLTMQSPGYRVWNSSWLNFYEFVSEGILMPLGALLMSLLIGWVYRKGTIRRECALSGNRLIGARFFEISYKFIVPVIVAIILSAQILDFVG